MVIVNFSEENMYPDYYPEIWQYDYGQILRHLRVSPFQLR